MEVFDRGCVGVGMLLQVLVRKPGMGRATGRSDVLFVHSIITESVHKQYSQVQLKL